MTKPSISIVTPSFNMLPYLRQCCASVRDQGVSYEHVVMDGASTDGTPEWLAAQGDVVSVSEKDNGMYHALNKAISRAKADIIGHLNCDEQYLPGILAFVVDFFERNPKIDFIGGNFLIIDSNGDLLAFRKSFQPRWPYFFSNYLYTTTCTLFYRKKIFNDCRFDESYRSIADAVFLYNVIKKGYRGIHIRKYFAAFTYSGDNLSLHPISKVEKARFNSTLPIWWHLLRPLLILLFFSERILNGNYREGPTLSYSIFTPTSQNERLLKTKRRPTFRLDFKLRAPAG